MNHYEEEYIEYEDKKSSVFNFLKNIKPLHIGILLFFTFIGLVYWQSVTNKDITTYIIVACVGAIGIYVLSRAQGKKNVTWETAKSILHKTIQDSMKEENCAFPKGELVITEKGYEVPLADYPIYYIYFYIREYKAGIEHWYAGKVRQDTGNYVGCQELAGDISGTPPREYEFKRYGDDED